MKSPLAALLVSIWLVPAALAKDIDWDKRLQKGYQELSLGNVNEAIKTFQSKVDSHPDSGACHTALGLALKKKGKLGVAKSEFHRATEVEPGYPEAYYELGSMQESDKEYSAAATSFEKFLQLKPDTDRKGVPDRIRFCKEQG